MPRKSLAPIPVAPVEEILQKNGAKRISFSASKKMAQVVSEIALQISESAVKISRHSNRKTIKARDIRLAYETSNYY